jgi:hypothetical protein
LPDEFRGRSGRTHAKLRNAAPQVLAGGNSGRYPLSMQSRGYCAFDFLGIRLDQSHRCAATSQLPIAGKQCVTISPKAVLIKRDRRS